MTCYGVDISHHNGQVDWRAVRADGIAFAVLKATEGLSYDWTDWYAAALDGARNAGMPVIGSYLFMHDADGAAQASYFDARLTAYHATVGHARELDVETAPGPDYPTAAESDAAARRIKAEIGGPVGLYTGYWYWSGILGNPPMPASVDHLWESRYVYNGVLRPWRDCADEVPAEWWTSRRCGGRSPSILQINSNAVVKGISGGVDLDVFPGTLDELRALMLGTGGDDMAQADIDAINAHTDAAVAEVLRVVAANLGAGAVNNPLAWLNAGIAARIGANERALIAPLLDDEAKLTAELEKLAVPTTEVNLDDVRAALRLALADIRLTTVSPAAQTEEA